MNDSEILAQVNDLIRQVFGNKNIHITEQTTARDVEEWDSFNNTRLLVAIEKHFGIRFALKEIITFSNVGKLCEGIKSKLG
ncbi:MAG: acyl carrier protein [Bacteroidetes bacterium]|nr:acyl carrier protein [Bacteroidota bacterium]